MGVDRESDGQPDCFTPKATSSNVSAGGTRIAPGKERPGAHHRSGRNQLWLSVGSGVYSTCLTRDNRQSEIDHA